MAAHVKPAEQEYMRMLTAANTQLVVCDTFVIFRR
jgi:hypothetical protein